MAGKGRRAQPNEVKRSHRMNPKNLSALLVGLLVCSLGVSAAAQTAVIPDPEAFFGHKPGADRALIRWEKMSEYFQLLGKNSDRIKIENLGKTTMGHPFILAVISSPENLANLARHKEIAKKLAAGRISKEEAEGLAAEGKTIALITCSMHATECGPTQMSPLLGYALATDRSPSVQRILDNVILLLIPSWNPDGNILTTDWYRRNLGTPFESAPMPWLYHYYVGHDNNRDAFMNTQVETRYVNRILYREWFPQLFLDMHQMGASDARLFLSPLYEPRHPSLDPIVTREEELTGAYMRTLLEEKGLIGVIHYALWNHWRMAAIHTCALWHNVTTILFEAASARMATPIFQTAKDLSAPDSGGLGKQGNTQMMTYPSPWPGGWWRLGDIVNYAYWSAFGFLESGALFREKYLLNMYRMARNSVEKGATEAPYAFIVPGNQKDPNRAAKMINILISDGAEIHRAESPFLAQNREYPAGTYVVLMSQAYRPFLMDVLGPQFYPDRRQYPGGPPEPAFDLTGWTLPYQMGVETITATGSFQARLEPIQKAEPPAGKVAGEGEAFILDHAVLDSFRAVNRLLADGYDVRWATESFSAGGKDFPAGSVLVSGSGIAEKVRALAAEFFLQVQAGDSPRGSLKLKPLKLGLYQPWTADMDEGWTRWIFDTWEFPYTTIHNEDIRNGGLKEKFDVILLASLRPQRIIEGHKEGSVPPPYAGGIGSQGLEALRAFVEDGGTLVTLNASAELALTQFKVPLRNAVGDYPSSEFFCPSAILKVKMDNTHPLAYGMGDTAAILFNGSPIFEILPGKGESAAAGASPLPLRVVARYPEENPFLSGFLKGDKVFHNRPALVDVGYGKGKIIIFGFRPQNRAQTEGTFKLLFNSLYYGPAATSSK
jgi:hypothetical protein